MKRKILAFLISICLGGCGLCFGWDQITHELTEWTTKRDLTASKSYYNRFVENFPLKEDQLLLDNLSGLHIPGRQPECIIGLGARIYGSDFDYELILVKYVESVKKMGWEYSETAEDNARLNFHDPDSILSISVFPSTENEFHQHIDMAGKTDAELAEWSSQYRTLYGITFTYAKPETGCLL
jgi:hypothetical protein